MIKQLKFQRLLAMLYIGAALSIMHFRWQFFNGSLFSLSEFSALFPHFDAYYFGARSLALPYVLLAFLMLLSSIPLWSNRWIRKGRILASFCAGAALFLGLLDLTYGFSSGLYRLDHPFAGVALEAGLSITVLGLIALLILLFASEHPEVD